ncbi:MAG: double-strand break repair protein AddB [Rhizobiaceae bacterium]
MEIRTVSKSQNITGQSGASKPTRIFSIPTGCDFLKVFVESLEHGRIIPGFVPSEDPMLLSTATIYVPNRRTGRALSAAFLASGKTKARLLPRIRTLGDIDEDGPFLEPEAADLEQSVRTVEGLERKLELTSLIQHWVGALSTETRRLYGDEDIFIPSSQADAVRLADDLCRLLDQITQEEISWNRIQEIVPQEHAEWWSITSTFLQIIMEHWPHMLDSQGLMDPAQRNRYLIDKRIERYRKSGSTGPVIVAGSTGSVPSTQRFQQVISGIENGAVVLPGLDMKMPEVEWREFQRASEDSQGILEGHPQFGLAQLLVKIGVDRSAVPELSNPTSTTNLRNQVVSKSMSLPEYSATWKEEIEELDPDDVTLAFSTVTMIEAANERQEATAIAIALREVLEESDMTAALVTPDRNLARRVAIELNRFDITVDDSAGLPLKSTSAGLFVRLVIRFWFGTITKSEFSELMKSPFLLAGLDKTDARNFGERIEILALRGTIGMPECCKVRAFLEVNGKQLDEFQSNEDPSNEAYENERQEILDRADELDRIFASANILTTSGNPKSLSEYVFELSKILAEIARDSDGNSTLECASGNREINKLFEEIVGTNAGGFEVSPDDFPSVFDALLNPLTVRKHEATHPRLHIYGPLEIRLLEHDRIIMAGLNEGIWPPATRNDAFLNRTMRQQLGMASPERRIGLAAHDFQQILGKKEVFLSRAGRVDKAPTIASRWLQRLMAILGEEQMKVVRSRGERYLRFAMELDNSRRKTGRQSRPAPKPPLSFRPSSLPVTDIETWIRDPYALYAKRILKLRPLAPLERDADPLLRGTLYHSILEEYVSESSFGLPRGNRLEILLDIAHRKIADQKLDADIELLWRYRFDEIAKQYVCWEETYSGEYAVRKIFKEIDGQIHLSNNTFRLYARADRIDILDDGRVVVLDYKTGSSPSLKQARSLSPQMALEGLIAVEGGFSDISRAELADLAFIRLVQGSRFGLQSIADEKNPVTDVVESAQENLEKLIITFQNEEMGYVSRRAPFREGEVSGDYDHLARTREWSFGEDGDADE